MFGKPTTNKKRVYYSMSIKNRHIIPDSENIASNIDLHTSYYNFHSFQFDQDLNITNVHISIGKRRYYSRMKIINCISKHMKWKAGNFILGFEAAAAAALARFSALESSARSISISCCIELILPSKTQLNSRLSNRVFLSNFTAALSVHQ